MNVCGSGRRSPPSSLGGRVVVQPGSNALALRDCSSAGSGSPRPAPARGRRRRPPIARSRRRGHRARSSRRRGVARRDGRRRRTGRLRRPQPVDADRRPRDASQPGAGGCAGAWPRLAQMTRGPRRAAPLRAVRRRKPALRRARAPERAGFSSVRCPCSTWSPWRSARAPARCWWPGTARHLATPRSRPGRRCPCRRPWRRRSPGRRAPSPSR